jgi:hypothetical protein
MILGPFFHLHQAMKAFEENYKEKVYYDYMRHPDRSEIHEWCVERFGETGRSGSYHQGVMIDLDKQWVSRLGCYYFHNRLHAFEFKLTWG